MGFIFPQMFQRLRQVGAGDHRNVSVVKVRHDGQAVVVHGIGKDADHLAHSALAADVHQSPVALLGGMVKLRQTRQVAEDMEAILQLMQAQDQIVTELIGLPLIELPRER